MHTDMIRPWLPGQRDYHLTDTNCATWSCAFVPGGPAMDHIFGQAKEPDQSPVAQLPGTSPDGSLQPEQTGRA